MCPQNDAVLLCYNFDVRQLILIILAREQAVKLWFIFPLYLSNASALPDRNTKIASCQSNVVIAVFTEFNQSLSDIFSFVDLQLIFTLLKTP